MVSLFILTVLSLLVAAAVGWAVSGAVGALVAVMAVSALRVMLEHARAARVLGWLRRGATEDVPEPMGIWGEVAYRAHQQLRDRNRAIAASDLRLQEFLAAIQASPNGVVLLDRAGHIEWCNRTAAEHFGFDARRDLMQLIGNLVRDPAFLAYYQREDFSRELALESPSSTASKPVRIAVQLHPYGEGRRLLLSRDITAIEQADTMRRDFVANVSHEIRTPLTVLSGFIETLQTLALTPDEQSRYLALMSTQASRMQSLVHDLLTLSRLDGSPPPGRGEWVALAPLLVTCEAEARALSVMQCGEVGHRLQFPGPLDPSVVGTELAGSSGELLSAISNLVNNAVRYTPAGGTVALRVLAEVDLNASPTPTRNPDTRLVIEVVDSGPGIAAEHLPRLTERFYRVDRSRSRDTGGTGLGLAIVKHVVQRHGGELQIESTVGSGSTFRILLPADRVRLAAPEKPAAALVA